MALLLPYNWASPESFFCQALRFQGKLYCKWLHSLRGQSWTPCSHRKLGKLNIVATGDVPFDAVSRTTSLEARWFLLRHLGPWLHSVLTRDPFAAAPCLYLSGVGREMDSLGQGGVNPTILKTSYTALQCDIQLWMNQHLRDSQARSGTWNCEWTQFFPLFLALVAPCRLLQTVLLPRLDRHLSS